MFLVTFPYFGYFNGYTAGKFYTFFNGSSWTTLAILATIFYPVTLFGSYCLIDTIDEPYSQRLFGDEGLSTNTFAILWLFLCLPGTLLGAYNGFISEKLSVPTKQARLSRDIPVRSRVSKCQRMVSASLLPFIAIYLQFGYFSASEYSITGLKTPKMNLVQTVKAQSDDFDTS